MSTINLETAEALSDGDWIDISRPLTAATPVWPGDHPVEVRTAREEGFVLSSFATTCHVGTHIDAPLHLDPGAEAVEVVPLQRLVGLAEVVCVKAANDRIDLHALPAGWEPRAARILVRSDGHPLNQPIGDSFAGLDPGLVD